MRGQDSRQAAESAGYSKSYSRVISHRLRAHPAVKQAIQTAHAELREKAMYDVEQAVVEIDKAVLFAYAQKNAMAIAKLLESKGKLFGLYVDRYQEVPIDLSRALREAQTRVINVMDITPPLRNDSLPASSVLTAVPGPFPRSPVFDD